MLPFITALAILVTIFIISSREAMKSIRNPKPLLGNGDKRLIDINKEKTRSMFDGVER